jgi:tetratricopeptide (TPR) repeat protein
MKRPSRTVLLVAILALAAAGAAVAGALLQGGDEGTAASGTTATAKAPALELAVIDRDDAEAKALRAAEALYENDRVADARAAFEKLARANPESVEAAIGAAVTAWPDGTEDAVKAIAEANDGSAVAHLNLGLVLLAAGDLEAAQSEWRAAERAEPDTPAALRAEDLLNSRSPPGRPQLVLEDFPDDLGALPVEQRIVEAASRAEKGGAEDWIVLGAALETAGHRDSARQAYDRAVELAPRNLAARVGAAVARFDKDDPSPAFSRLGPLAAAHPKSALVRFHLGLMLLWLPDLDGARTQLERAQAAEPNGFYGRQAARVLARLEEAQ